MRISVTIAILLLIVGVILGSSSMYVVREGTQAVITEFGKPVKTVKDAGLYFKKPLVQKVHLLDKRLLPWDGDPENMQTKDKKRIFIDVWARWHIIDPMKYFRAVRTERRGYKILDDLVDSAVRDVVASHNLIEVVRTSNRELRYEIEELGRHSASARDTVTAGRAKMEADILRIASTDLKERYGMELADIQIKRVNYIESVRRTVFDRMKSERMQIAQLFQSEAQEERNKILGLTQKELEGIKGDMQQRSAEIRGTADAEVIRIAAAAFAKSPEFYGFLRRLEAYRNTLGGGTTLILSTDNEFLRQLRGPSMRDPNEGEH